MIPLRLHRLGDHRSDLRTPLGEHTSERLDIVARDVDVTRDEFSPALTVFGEPLGTRAAVGGAVIAVGPGNDQRLPG